MPKGAEASAQTRSRAGNYDKEAMDMVRSMFLRWIAAATICACTVLGASFSGEAHPVAATTFSGQATAVRATVLGIRTTLSDTGPLPSSGGSREASLLDVSAGGLSAEVLHASTVGQGDGSRSEASVAAVALTIEGNTVAAEFLGSRSAALCTDTGPVVSGDAEIVNLTLNGQAVVVAGTPNQTILLPNGRIVINEQSSAVSGNTAEITVNALHVVIDGIADVVIASAYTDVGCGPADGCDGSGEFVTGGGWITGTPGGARANFAVAGGKEPGWGHLVYTDHGPNRMKVKGTGITAYSSLGGNARRIEGTATVNGQGGITFQADVADNGEPGRMDTFTLRLGTGYEASGMLEGGNIQLHSPCR